MSRASQEKVPLERLKESATKLLLFSHGFHEAAEEALAPIGAWAVEYLKDKLSIYPKSVCDWLDTAPEDAQDIVKTIKYVALGDGDLREETFSEIRRFMRDDSMQCCFGVGIDNLVVPLPEDIKVPVCSGIGVDTCLLVEDNGMALNKYGCVLSRILQAKNLVYGFMRDIKTVEQLLKDLPEAAKLFQVEVEGQRSSGDRPALTPERLELHRNLERLRSE